MYKKMNQNKIKQNTKKLLSCVISASLTGLFSTSISHASDIEIYKNPTVKGHTIVMLALDNSFSMGLTDSGKNKSRLAILKESLRDVLQGVKDVNGNYTTTPLPDNTIVGLSTFGTTPRHGRIVVPARALNAMVASKSQRQVLFEEIDNIKADASTPTSLLYGETVSYLRGTATSSPLEILSVFDGDQTGVHTHFDHILDSSIKSPLLSGKLGGNMLLQCQDCLMRSNNVHRKVFSFSLMELQLRFHQQLQSRFIKMH